MLKTDLKKIKAYGDRRDDGLVQLSFTLPVSASPEAREAARLYAQGLGLDRVVVSTMERMGEGFSYFVVYGQARHSVDVTAIKVPKVDMPEMNFEALKGYMAANLERPLVVVGATTGDDAHTVGIDAIMNMKGFAGDWGLERYPLFKAVNLRSQMSNAELISKAVELKADAILISQVVTQRDSYVDNLKEFRRLAMANEGLSRSTILIVGGPRLDHASALKLGFDAGFGAGTKPSQVAGFIVREFMKRHGIRPRAGGEAAAHKEKMPHHRHAARIEGLPADRSTDAVAQGGDEGLLAQPVQGPKRRRRRRGRRGGRRHRKRHTARPDAPA